MVKDCIRIRHRKNNGILKHFAVLVIVSLSINQLKISVMKHAFIFGTTIFLSERNTLTYSDGLSNIEFLRILSFYDEHKGKVLTIDANINTPNGEAIRINANANENSANVRLD